MMVLALGEVCDFLNGGTPSKKVPAYFTGTTPWISSADIDERGEVTPPRVLITDEAISNSATRLIPKGTPIIVTRTGIGKVCRAPFDLCFSQDITAIVPSKSQVDEDYLVHFLRSRATHFKSRQRGATIQGITRSVLAETQIPLPPVAEQKRIAAILDKANELKEKRKQAIAKMDELVHSVFIDMFGDPVSNPMGWERLPLGECLTDILGGQSVGGEDGRESDEEWAVLKISAVTSGTFRPQECKRVPVDLVPAPSKLVLPQKGDLLFSRANTRELVAAVALVEQCPRRLFLPDKLWKLVPAISIADSVYLRYLLGSGIFRAHLTKNATGTSGSMLNISMAKLRGIVVPVPPLTKQMCFAEIERRIRLVWAGSTQSEAAIVDAVGALQQEYLGR